ncbi:hypothetical protein [Xenorhabdus indica]|uniref:hypothetical protein n=1 Tax=Xenorhabdus indica TaxID=333964 RepID=UPI001656EFEA|nr:hypothetical protein [Xenorhabdus indica]MBC8944643.1 hypothetical protein [Xenorhabdus indica]
MNNDVIELAREIKKRSEAVLSAEQEENGEYPKYFFHLSPMVTPQNLIKLCAEIEKLHNKLAEYENMEPMAYYNLVDGKICKSTDDFDKGKTMFAVCLYPHPNKQ